MDASSAATLPTQETDVTVLKDTLRSQQQLLQKLYSELDVERESSATATNEALSMILRLQGEKAAMKMEASQYKRLAEEKIGHAEESLAILEELVYQKEMEISSLEFQIQAYRYKLLSLGYDDLNDLDSQCTMIQSTEKTDGFIGEKGIKSTVKRLSSLPASLPIGFGAKKNSNDGENNLGPVQDLCSSADTGSSDMVVCGLGSESRRSSVNSTTGDFKSYLEQIRLLDEKVKEISNGELKKNSDVSKSHEDSLERSISSTACCTSIVHDIFEVTETRAKKEKCIGKSVLGSDDRLTKPDLIMEDTLGLPVKGEIDCIKMNNFLSAKPEKVSCKLRDEYGTECVKVNKVLSVNHDKSLYNKLIDHTDADCKSGLICRATTDVTDYQSELKQLSQRVEQLESGRNNARHDEIVEAREEELNLLKDVRERLNLIQSEMQNWRPKKLELASRSAEVDLVPLTEIKIAFEPFESQLVDGLAYVAWQIVICELKQAAQLALHVNAFHVVNLENVFNLDQTRSVRPKSALHPMVA
ncbi:hypothetical protein Golob_014180 [Gossypium lobatum]|uniref:GTD-binding domain-containing protein n=1 Tax=Gossypium lobatum TaxID=34289 RepID=A0A7J8LS40_9ROSI|nr:hypothetical protein [Gossypium lobatum]